MRLSLGPGRSARGKFHDAEDLEQAAWTRDGISSPGDIASDPTRDAFVDSEVQRTLRQNNPPPVKGL